MTPERLAQIRQTFRRDPAYAIGADLADELLVHIDAQARAIETWRARAQAAKDWGVAQEQRAAAARAGETATHAAFAHAIAALRVIGNTERVEPLPMPDSPLGRAELLAERVARDEHVEEFRAVRERAQERRMDKAALRAALVERFARAEEIDAILERWA